MLTFISCAKTMTEKTPSLLPPAPSPLFIDCLLYTSDAADE